MGISIERLPPERAGRAPVAAAAGSCCCCCCCCLHSVGGLIGAATAKPPPMPAELPPSAVVGAPTAEPRYTAGREYWLSLLIICCVGVPAYAAAQIGAERLDLDELMLVLAMVLPGLQLLASLSALVLVSVSKRPGQQQRIRHVGRITGRAFLGALFGLVIMVPLASLL